MSFPDAHIMFCSAYHRTYHAPLQISLHISLHDMCAHIILKTENISGRLKTETQFIFTHLINDFLI